MRFWRRAGRRREDVITPQHKVKEFFLFKQLKVMISHLQSHSWFLTFTSASSDSFFFFLLKRCGNFSSDATGNRELFQWQQILVFQYCITAARSWLLTRDHDKWLEAPRGEWSPLSSPKSSPNPPQCLPRVETGWGQMFWILDIRMEKCTVVNLDGEKKIMPYWYRNNLNYSSFLHMHLSTYEYMYVQASMQWHHYSNVSHYLVSFHSHHLLQQGSGGE